MSIWATVTALGPLRIRLDGDSTALPFTPDSLIDTSILEVNDRVRCEVSQRRVIVHGRAGGFVLPDPTEPRTATVTTSSLANNATWEGTITIAEAFTLLVFGASFRSRWRVYASAAHRAADLSRPVGVAPAVNSGLLFEEDGQPGTPLYAINPVGGGINLDGTAVAVAVQNLSGATRTITGTFLWR